MGGEPIYIVDIFLDPNYTNGASEPLKGWFLEYLKSHSTHFSVLIATARRLPGLGPVAKLHQHCCTLRELNEACSALNRAIMHVEATQECVAAVQECI